MIEVGGAMKRRRAGCRRQAPQRLERVLQRTCMQASTSTRSPTHPFRARTRMKLPIHFLPPAIRAQSGKSLTSAALSPRASPFESPCVRQSLRPWALSSERLASHVSDYPVKIKVRQSQNQRDGTRGRIPAHCRAGVKIARAREEERH
jgi:hypothetical protein